ncbi:peptidoglycan DD-metalloendopeptidase family protein [Solirubrobacter ginsenosidimutans]|uniref:Peptidoglycan DD-metalloendopeptidase family protein n=1 Tax=Solirubrobacter ginsenosidimutans TaxID=490573 RepID=A0A9X3MYD2_9ACTN|nr:M23 family metallopeptidase [Solirubrobacter ginsenosidimutans]MDA0163901.1 peptidoglycan DD-metalloendopeptidase family protein [Solirubrobacter ginsenosidimutans]
MRLRLTLLVLVTSLPFVLWSVLPVGSSAQNPGTIQKKIDRSQSLIGGHKAKERVLTTDISSQTKRINDLQSDITRLSTRQQTLQTSLDQKRAQLAVVQRKLREERARLTRLRARLLVVRRALADRLVQLYKADAPDAITVVLESDGFADLLNRADFMERVSRQDSKIMGVVASAKTDATTTAKKLDGLEKQQAKVTKDIQNQRDEVSTVRVGLVDRRDRIQTARSQKNQLLASSRDRRHKLEDDVEVLQKQQAKIQAKLAGYSGPMTSGPAKPGSGGLIWPVNGPITSPFCESRAWESCHPGIDIGVPSGTPIHAAAAGKVVLMQSEAASGGYGNFTCIQHTGSLSTCYAHQSRFATSLGAQVSQGQVIGFSGCTGRCYGDHLHFETRVNGSVVNPLNYL